LTNNTDRLKLPNSLLEFYCDYTQISSFTGLILPSSLERFGCYGNKITSFAELKFDAHPVGSLNNSINSFLEFNCSDNDIKFIRDFVFPSNLIFLQVDSKVRFINSKFNSAVKDRLENKVEFNDQVKLTHDELIFLYLNFNISYQECESMITKFEDQIRD
jgi:Leucine-rich repeat (LRR) protein